VIIIDEPFSALDPVNTQMVKDLLNEERNKGRTVVMCTHQMHQAETMCNQIVLIDQGSVLLNGDVHEIRHSFSGRDILIESPDQLPDLLPGVHEIKKENGNLRCTLEANTTSQELLKTLVGMNIQLDRFEVAVPSLDDVFIQVVKGKTE
jgi:ABC-2 type transport system ATP-binding protein